MSEYGIKISLPGYDVKTATPEQCAVHSDYPVPKIAMDKTPSHFGIVHYTIPKGTYVDGTYNIFVTVHGWGYVPTALVYGGNDLYFGQQNSPLPLSIGDSLGLTYYVDDNILSIDYTIDSFGSGSIVLDADIPLTFKYYIFVEDGA